MARTRNPVVSAFQPQHVPLYRHHGAKAFVRRATGGDRFLLPKVDLPGMYYMHIGMADMTYIRDGLENRK